MGDLHAQPTWLNVKKIYIRFSHSFFVQIAGNSKPYPFRMEQSAEEGSNESVRELAKIWFYLKESILLGEVRSVPDHLISDFAMRAEQYGKYWLGRGALRNDAQSFYHLSLVYRFGNQTDNDLADEYAKEAVKIWSDCVPTREDLLGLISCYGHGWGVSVDLMEARRLYSQYVQVCRKENKRALKWTDFGLP